MAESSQDFYNLKESQWHLQVAIVHLLCLPQFILIPTHTFLQNLNTCIVWQCVKSHISCKVVLNLHTCRCNGCVFKINIKINANVNKACTKKAFDILLNLVMVSELFVWSCTVQDWKWVTPVNLLDLLSNMDVIHIWSFLFKEDMKIFWYETIL